ncbi:acyl-CoA dehydrogenase [Ktedonosporobacter rubrisoli]|uniref:Acyl-CoA dehydrogenase n=1 Tax=Ktedonosporobacter rubrisoli TaxID=2509675 RepID=A0A4P6JQ03_KTERU|nr:acyl-CoA dehydrogenase family protein [Ktedonosporobacter rubrisoli]QBD77182.1 acyl-CoA dehydrogenase [Ktedonosporobacter rubrisoli]
MHFAWTQEQNQLYQRILQASQEILHEESKDLPRWWTRAHWEACARIGLLGLSIAERYGGQGYDALTTSYAVEAFGRGCVDMGLVFSASAHLFSCCMPLAEYGSADLKERWLPGLCAGSYIGANASTEKEAGSDIFALKTQAWREANGYILRGVKSYVSNGPLADLFLVYARTNPAHGYLGITAFLVERETPGLLIGESFEKLGLTSTPVCQILLDECYIPVHNRLGQEGQGALIFKRSMQWERACLFAAYVGQMERQLEQTISYAQKRSQFGTPIGKKQVIAHRIANMKLRLESARFLLYHACWLFSQQKDATQAIALSKLAVSEAAIQNSLDALQIYGSAGVSGEDGIERMVRDALPATIFSGTSEIQREIIAKELGL